MSMKTTYTHLFFDLDGTLTDSAEGVMKGVRYALERMNRPVPDERVLRLFVGPPLQESFHELGGVAPEAVPHAIELFREYYLPTGSYENRAFPGIDGMLGRLRAAGYHLGVATSKLESQAFAVLERYRLAGYFEQVAGAGTAGKDSKAEVLARLMALFGLGEGDKPRMLMIGDRKYDVVGAHTVGIDCMTVGWGYAPPEELTAYPGALHAATMADLERILIGE